MNTAAAKKGQKKDARRARYALLNLTWKMLRTDLRHAGAEELREARLDFAQQVLGCGPIGSFSQLTIPQLDRVIDAMNRRIVQPTLAGAEASFPAPTEMAEVRSLRESIKSSTSEAGDVELISPLTSDLRPLTYGAEVFHLATEEQAWAIEKIFEYLGWSEGGSEGFLKKNFRRPTARMLSPRQAGSAVTILLTIAAHRDLKARAFGAPQKISRGMMRAEMPALKKRIGLDQKPPTENCL